MFMSVAHVIIEQCSHYCYIRLVSNAHNREKPMFKTVLTLFPKRTAVELSEMGRSMFSAVHGMVTLGLEQKLIEVPIGALRKEIATIVKAMVNGLALEAR